MGENTASNPYGFSEENYDWSRYARVRPKYPKVLYDQILDYHRTHGNGSLQVAHDVGAGYGIVAQEFLAPHFAHVYVSDPIAHNLEPAKQRLASLGSQMTIRQAGAEEQWLPPASVDLITAFECLHWCEPNSALQSLAAQLRPGGTLAALYYTPRPYMASNRRADKIWDTIFDGVVARSYEPTSNTRKYLGSCYGGMDTHVPLPPSLWEKGAQRVNVNTDLLKDSPYNTPDTPFKMGRGHHIAQAINHVGPDDIRTSFVDLENYGLRADYNWLYEFLASLQPKQPLDKMTEELAELKAAVEEEGGTTQVAWIMQLLFATRKKE